MKKVAIECIDKEQGKKIIEYLESLDGNNKKLYKGNAVGKYYYINKDNIIEHTRNLPLNYSIIALPRPKQYSLTF